jgi:tRNA nucleotidyltransferase (CCA-adding enzyme)
MTQPPHVGQTYLVGGAVRDGLLGRPVRERDWVVVGATADALRALGYRRVGRDFPVFLHPVTHEEYALARTERKTGAGHTGFECYAGVDVTLEADLARRDLTVNALARDADGRLLDPWGGLADLESRVLRHVSPAFVEDPLRVFRVARFAAELADFDFRVAPETLALMRDMAAQGALVELAAERIWQELEKALAAPAPGRFFEVLAACGGLADWFPELSECVAQIGEQCRVLAAALDRFGGLGWLVAPDAIATLCDRLKSPTAHRKLALAVATHARVLVAWRETLPDRLLEAVESCGALRQPAQFERCVRIAAALSGEDLAPLQARIERVRATSTEQLRAEGLTGAALGEALRRERLAVLAAPD